MDATSRPLAPRRTIGAVTVLLLLVAPHGPASQRTPRDEITTLSNEIAARWTRQPMPPSFRTGAAFARAGAELVLWGGCDPGVRGECRPTSDGYAFDPATGAWRPVPFAPVAGSYARGVSTATAVIFLTEPSDEGRLVAQSYEPARDSWSRLPSPPLRSVAEAVWTGTEVLVWSEGSRRRPRVWRGAAYEVATGRWRRISDPPLALNLVDGVWTGTEVVLFGSLLDGRNWPETRTAVGLAYAPATDRWRRLPPSRLSPQATSAALAGDHLVAWDYETTYQRYDPVLNRWTRRADMPLDFSECYPNSEVARGALFAFFCGQAAVYRPVLKTWREVNGGPLADTIKAGSGRIHLWRFARMDSTGDAVYALLEGITVNKRGVPCFGCPGAPRSFWSFRPGPLD